MVVIQTWIKYLIIALCVRPVLLTLPVVEIIDADEEGEVGEHAEDQARQEGLGGGVIKN